MESQSNLTSLSASQQFALEFKVHFRLFLRAILFLVKEVVCSLLKTLPQSQIILSSLGEASRLLPVEDWFSLLFLSTIIPGTKLRGLSIDLQLSCERLEVPAKPWPLRHLHSVILYTSPDAFLAPYPLSQSFKVSPAMLICISSITDGISRNLAAFPLVISFLHLSVHLGPS